MKLYSPIFFWFLNIYLNLFHLFDYFFYFYTQICFKHKIIILLNKISDLKFIKEWVWIEINRKIK